jgi:heptosyltransferase-1
MVFYFPGQKARPIPLSEIRRIALIQPSRIGDIVFSLPTLAGLRRIFPQAHIAWLVDERCRDLVEGHPDLDEAIIIPFKTIEQAIRDRQWGVLHQTYRRLKRELRQRSFDLSLDLHGLAKSALLVLMAGARFRIGSANTNGMKELSGFFSREIPPRPRDVHTVERNLALIRFLEGAEESPSFNLKSSFQERAEVRAILDRTGREREKELIIIHPGAGWLSRRWPVERFADLIHELKQTYPVNLAVIGGAEGGSKEDRLFERLFSLLQVPVIDLVNRLTLRQLTALLEEAALFIGNEAGPMHLAGALKRPVVAMIGPTRPERTGPYGDRAFILRKEVGCNPCRERNCTDLKCMKAIEVADVLEAVRQAWKLH